MRTMVCGQQTRFQPRLVVNNGLEGRKARRECPGRGLPTLAAGCGEGSVLVVGSRPTLRSERSHHNDALGQYAISDSLVSLFGTTCGNVAAIETVAEAKALK